MLLSSCSIHRKGCMKFPSVGCVQLTGQCSYKILYGRDTISIITSERGLGKCHCNDTISIGPNVIKQINQAYGGR